MKKYILCGLLVGLSFFVGCSPLLNEKMSSKSSESSVVQENIKKVETSTKLNKQKIQEVMVAYQSLSAFEDNMIGNITYNFTDAMSDEDFTVIHEVIDVYYLSLKKGIVERHEAAKLELDRLGFEKEALEDFLKTEEKIAEQQTEWSTKMVGFTKENAMELKQEIADNQLAYQLDSQESGYKLLNLLKSAGMSEDEAKEMMKTIILEAMELYGDPQDIEQINS